jgi:5-methylcytosine-specific restriction protein A
MSRREFPQSVKVAAIKRATRDGLIFCEECGCLAKRVEIDHVRADGLLGEPTLENAMVLCKPCHDEKSKSDTTAIAQAKRREAKHLNARPRPKQPIQSANTLRSNKPKPDKLPMLPPRQIYR